MEQLKIGRHSYGLWRDEDIEQGTFCGNNRKVVKREHYEETVSSPSLIPGAIL